MSDGRWLGLGLTLLGIVLLCAGIFRNGMEYQRNEDRKLFESIEARLPKPAVDTFLKDGKLMQCVDWVEVKP